MINFDIDIDLADRDQFLKHLRHIPASIKKDDGTLVKHNSGVYLQKVPCWPLQNVAVYDYKEAPELGYFKIDFLNNGIYTGVRSNRHLDELAGREPDWSLLEVEEIVQQLAQVSGHYSVLEMYKPRSILELAVVIAMIRPAKRYLIGRDRADVEQDIWSKPIDGSSYYYKKSHAVAFALSIVVQLNLLVEST